VKSPKTRLLLIHPAKPSPWSVTCTQTGMPTQTPAGLFIEDRSKVTAALAAQLAGNRYVGQFRTVSASELRAMTDRILDYYNKWAAGDEWELAACLDFVENVCFALSIPLAETAYGLYVIRDGISAILNQCAENESSETIRQVNSFFELLVRDLLRRY
jgi:hypothetical protein